MKTLHHSERTQLEKEILGCILSRPELFDSFELRSRDFSTPLNLRIFDFICNLKAQGKPIEYLSFLNDFSHLEVANLFSNEYVEPKNYTLACEKLREDCLRIAINQKTEQCGNSLEFFQSMDVMKQVNTIGTLQDFEEQIEEYGKEYEKIQERQKKGLGVGLLNSWKQFSKKVSLIPGDYCILGARPSIGKTSFALNMAIDAALLGQKVLFISAEMSQKHIFDKIAATLSMKPAWGFKFAKHPVGDVKALLRALRGNFQFIYLPVCTTGLITQIMKKAGKLDCVFIDYLQLLKDQPYKNDTENLRIGRISGVLKALGGTNECVMVIAAQLSRDNEKQKRKPMLSDLRDSGAIEQDADVVMLLHRDTRETPETELIVAKQRTGETCTINFLFNPEWNYFKENNEIISP